MIAARKIALRVNGVQPVNARVRRVQKGPELVITDPRLGEFVADETLTLELLELLHPHEIRRNLPNRWLEESFAADIDCVARECGGPDSRRELTQQRGLAADYPEWRSPRPKFL